MPTILEKHVEHPVVQYARDNGVLVVKQTHAGARSHPDRAFYFPGGKLLQIEFKAPGALPTKLQAATILKLRDLGFEVYVIDNRERGIALVRHFLMWPNSTASLVSFKVITVNACMAALAKPAPKKRRTL